MWVLVAFAIDVVIPFDLIYDNRGHVATIGIKEKQRWLPTQMLPTQKDVGAQLGLTSVSTAENPL